MLSVIKKVSQNNFLVNIKHNALVKNRRHLYHILLSSLFYHNIIKFSKHEFVQNGPVFNIEILKKI